MEVLESLEAWCSSVLNSRADGCLTLLQETAGKSPSVPTTSKISLRDIAFFLDCNIFSSKYRAYFTFSDKCCDFLSRAVSWFISHVILGVWSDV